MNNLKPYNLSKFNISSDGDSNLDIEMNCYEKYNTIVTFSKNTELKMTCDEALNNKPNLSMTTPTGMNLKVDVDMEAKLLSYIIVEFNGLEEINNKAYLSSNISITQDFEEKIIPKVSPSLSIEFKNDFEEEINNLISVGKNILIKEYLQNEELLTNFAGNFIDNKILNISINLNPGQTLVIDSNNFTAFIDDINVLNEYDGTWINLSRAIETIEISTVEGNELSGEVIYKEYYL